MTEHLKSVRQFDGQRIRLRKPSTYLTHLVFKGKKYHTRGHIENTHTYIWISEKQYFQNSSQEIVPRNGDKTYPSLWQWKHPVAPDLQFVKVKASNIKYIKGSLWICYLIYCNSTNILTSNMHILLQKFYGPEFVHRNSEPPISVQLPQAKVSKFSGQFHRLHPMY